MDMCFKKYIAADFGAGSGRIITGCLPNNKLQLKDIHRFDNQPVKRDGHIFWDFPYLKNELIKGITKAVTNDSNIYSIGVDTWGVDYGLLDKNDEMIDLPYCYRDTRTDGIMKKVFEIVDERKLFNLTGTQLMQINTLFQLYSTCLHDAKKLEKAKTILMMPDLFNFYLTGEKNTEYTIASTSQLLNPVTKDWHQELFDLLDITEEKMAPVSQPGKEIGHLDKNELKIDNKRGINVIAVGSHDTASAVLAVPAEGEDWAFISSGTWSLIGTELDKPIINEKSFQLGFTNEGGANNKIRFLKNVTGMWLLEECIKNWKMNNNTVSYEHLIEQAKSSPSFQRIINPDDDIFLHPDNMMDAIVEFCEETNQKAPRTQGEFVSTIFESLALKYNYIIQSLQKVTDKKINKIHIIGGACQNDMLNQFTANATEIPVLAGPVEATATGNIIMQMLASGKLRNLAEARKIVKSSFPITTYEPQNTEYWEEEYNRYKYLF